MPTPTNTPIKPESNSWRALAGVCVALFLVLVLLFSASFTSGKILFSSDGPLGANSAAYFAPPSTLVGVWQDLYWVGGSNGTAFPNLTILLLWQLQPLLFAKFFTPITLFFIGFCVWVLFRALGFRPAVCTLGALAAALNTDFLSYACWGLGTLPLSVGAVFLGLAALVTRLTNRVWLKVALAGLAVGASVMEGFDTGAILSLYFAAFVVFQAVSERGSLGKRLATGFGRVALVAVAAGFLATAALQSLISTQVQGVVGMQQDQKTKAERWDQATMWSLPKAETLRVIVPGLFGYRMDTPDGGNYWGSVGQQPGVITTRHSGSGVYGGVVVCVVAFWAMFQSLRRKKSVFSDEERRQVNFWLEAMLVSLLLAWGRHAPFYQLVYALPYFSTIRNPIKFMHPFHVGLVIVFGYGLHGMWKRYLDKPLVVSGAFREHLKKWWQAAPVPDKGWMTIFGAALGASLVGWLLYAASENEVEQFLKQAVSDTLAPAIAKFSLKEVGWSILFLVVSGVVFLLILSGVFAGPRAKWATICLGLLLIADFSRADAPWVYYWDFPSKYASNPVLDQLRDHAYERRVAAFPFQINDQYAMLGAFYHQEWMQHQFPYYNIQSIDVVQDPRPTIENETYRHNFLRHGIPGVLRMWELTNTRLVLGFAGPFVDALNQQIDPVSKRFRLSLPFTIEQTGPDVVLVKTNATGPFAFLEFTGGLPRAKLYSAWQVNTNDTEVLDRLADPAFEPSRTVMVDAPASTLAPTAAATNAAPGEVKITQYAPKQIELQATATAASVLLLNDKFDPHWSVTVDGQPQPVLRCNFLMRGVMLTPGTHTVVFRFSLPTTALKVSLAAIALGFGLLGLLAYDARSGPAQAKKASP